MRNESDCYVNIVCANQLSNSPLQEKWENYLNKKILPAFGVKVQLIPHVGQKDIGVHFYNSQIIVYLPLNETFSLDSILEKIYAENKKEVISRILDYYPEEELSEFELIKLRLYLNNK